MTGTINVSNSSVRKDGYVTAEIARWAEQLEYKHLSAEAVHQAKRFLLDSVGCALGAFLQHDIVIALDVLRELAGKGPATLIGTGEHIDVASATLANALMIRSLDYNDIYWKQDPSHPSDLIPAAFSTCEREGSNGRELLVGIALGYEFEMRFCEAGFPGVEERGWHHATLTGFVSPIVAGRMLRLSAAQIQNAIGISGCCHVTLGSVSAGELTMMKNTADPMATQSGVIAALLAKRGYTGPAHVIDGAEGFTHCMGSGWKLETLTEGLGESWRIDQCGMKGIPTEALTHAPVSALLHLVNSRDLQPEQVKRITVHTLARAAHILSDPSKYDPRTRETADHSLPYVLAIALVDRQVTPASFTMEKIMDPRVRLQLKKVQLVGDAEIDAVFPRLQKTTVHVILESGETLTHHLDYPKGDPRNPLSDVEVEEKYMSLTEGILSPSAQKRLKDAILGLEGISSVAELMSLMKSDRQAAHVK
jgi:2-methylcitrate dehydratase